MNGALPSAGVQRSIRIAQSRNAPQSIRVRARVAALGCTLAGLFAAGNVHCAAQDQPREWLEKMNRALSERNYDGTFFHLSRGEVETLRIVHRVHAGQVTERLISLDGSQREFIRTTQALTCYLPDQRTVWVAPRDGTAPFLGSLPQFNSAVDQFYDIRLLSAARMLGRSAKVISVSPKDQFRFGYRLWLDEQSAMPLKTELCDARGRVVEQIVFASLDLPESIPEAAVQPGIKTDGLRWVRQTPSRELIDGELSAFRVSRLPPGFRLMVSGAQTLDEGSRPAAHLVYSDGLASVSVFVEQEHEVRGAQGGGPPVQGLSRIGAGYAFSTVVDGHQVTAVGEVPAQTVEFIAHSVTPAAVSH